LQLSLDRIKELGATVVAVSPETPQSSLITAKKNNVTFEVLGDAGNSVAAKFGLVHRLPEDLLPVYETFGINISEANGDQSFELPITATYIINTDGKIRKAFVDADHTKRLDPEDAIAVLQDMARGEESLRHVTELPSPCRDDFR
jgi:peroxiredoxin